MSRSNQQRAPAWRGGNPERHYCEICNAWMGGDRQSILLHENGKKHQDNAEKMALRKRQERAAVEQQATQLQNSLKAMEAAALQSHASDLTMFASTTQAPHFMAPPAVPMVAASSQYAVPTTMTASNSASTAAPNAPSSNNNNTKQTKQEWQIKKEQRQEEKQRKRKKGEGGDDSDNSEEEEQDVGVMNHDKNRRKIAPDEGHYTYDNVTYLEGLVFGDMLEEDMPVEIWTGNLLASRAEKQLPHRHDCWKRGLVAAVRKRPTAPDYDDRLAVDVAYLREPTDTEETLDKHVPLNRIRIVLGGDNDNDEGGGGMIPDTLEAARLLAMGGVEEEIVVNTGTTSTTGIAQEEIDEATGLTSWSTVKIKKTTVHQECKEERERIRQKRREAAAEADRVQREADRRKMEHAKVANADDSALGAYDVWSRGNKEGYKGVDIHGEAKVEVHDFGKKLADGKTAVGFKKSAFKSNQKKKKQNRRTTSADDD